MAALKKPEPSVASNPQSVMDEQTFVAELAHKFRNLSHLAKTLSDAPPSIKKLQTKLYIAILSELTPADQEKQIADLDDAAIKDMIDQAVSDYEKMVDPKTKQDYKKIV